MMILIPSSGRSERILTLQAIPPKLRDAVWLVVYPEEAAAYSKIWGQVVIATPPKRGIAYKRQWIVDNVQFKQVLVIDDDLRRICTRRLDDPGKFVGASEIEATQVLETMWGWLQEGIAQVGLLGREGANRITTLPYIELTRSIQFVGINLDTFRNRNIRYDRVEFRGDFDATLQLFRAGYKNRVLTTHISDFDKPQRPGGCTPSRTPEKMNATAEELAALHPMFVDTVLKDNLSNAEEWSTRTDVRVQWRRCYEFFNS